MKHMRSTIIATLALGAATLQTACSDSGATSPSVKDASSGTMVVRLTDAPFLSDSVKSVDIFVVRVDARVADVDSATADHGLSDDSSATGGWKSVAAPNTSFNLLSLQNGIAATLGQATLAAGTYDGFRFIIDPTRSSVTLRSGQVLSGSTSPGISFPSASRSGIKIVLTQPVTITAGTTTTLLVDFNVNDSFVMRGNSIDKNGLLFKPVIKATVINLALTNATVRLVNATASPVDFLQNGSILSGGSDIVFGTSSSCSSVNAAMPGLTVTLDGSTAALAGFSPTLSAGTSYSIIAYQSSTTMQLATLSNAFIPPAGQSGLRVFNATTGATGVDVFVTAPGAPLTTPTIAAVLSASSSTFVGVPAGTSQVRVVTAGGTTVLLDLGSQAFTAGQDVTLVLAPPALGSTTLRGFFVTGC